MEQERSQQEPGDGVLHRVDHLVLATPDLPSTVAELEARLGVRAAVGGQHPGRGTHNALIATSLGSYLEIVAADPSQPEPDRPRWFRIDSLSRPALVTWAAKCDDLDRATTEAQRNDVQLGAVLPCRRSQPDGTILDWRLTDPATVVSDGVVPFLIDWGDSPHPAASAPRGPDLLKLRARHPDPAAVQANLRAIGLALHVEHGARPELIATFNTPGGPWELS